MRLFWFGLAMFLGIIGVGMYFWQQQAQKPPPPPPPVESRPLSPPDTPTIRHPVQPPIGISVVPPLEQADKFVQDRIIELLGLKAFKDYIQAGNFVRRVVATIDNLSRPLAPPRMWPIRPIPGRFSALDAPDGSIISPLNAKRYAPFVAFVGSIDSQQAVVLYRLLYPLFQKVYEQLGYPGKYFNDRVVQVIDLLLATPERSSPLKVYLPKVQGPLKPTHPWLLYRFSDPELESLSSGQKMLLRVGLKNERLLKEKLKQLRKLITR